MRSAFFVGFGNVRILYTLVFQLLVLSIGDNYSERYCKGESHNYYNKQVPSVLAAEDAVVVCGGNIFAVIGCEGLNLADWEG